MTDDPEVCECRHYPEEHRPHAVGACRGRDSYGLPCQCPSYEEMDDGDDEEGVPVVGPEFRPAQLKQLREAIHD